MLSGISFTTESECSLFAPVAEYEVSEFFHVIRDFPQIAADVVRQFPPNYVLPVQEMLTANAFPELWSATAGRLTGGVWLSEQHSRQ